MEQLYPLPDLFDQLSKALDPYRLPSGSFFWLSDSCRLIGEISDRNNSIKLSLNIWIHLNNNTVEITLGNRVRQLKWDFSQGDTEDFCLQVRKMIIRYLKVSHLRLEIP